MTSFLLLSIALGAIIVIALAVYAGKLIFMLKRQNNSQQAVRNKRIASMQTSIQTIAFAMHQQQCDLSEGVIRICRLLEALPVSPLPNFPKRYPALHALFDKVKDYPTHENRSALSKQERRSQDIEREQFESELETAIIRETEDLRKFQP